MKCAVSLPARQPIDHDINRRGYTAVVVRYNQRRICLIGGGTQCDDGVGRAAGFPAMTVRRQVAETIEHSHRYSVP
jgi:hypothetical protein